MFLGFLSPKGKFNPCNNGDHIMLACYLLKADCNDLSFTLNPVDMLCTKYGYVVIQEHFIGFAGFEDIGYIKHLTEYQIDWLKENKDEFSQEQLQSLKMCFEIDELVKEEVPKLEEIKLNTAYVSDYDNIQYPIYQISDNSYICKTYSCRHKCYNFNLYTKEEFNSQGFKEDESCNDLFEEITKENLKHSCFCC